MGDLTPQRFRDVSGVLKRRCFRLVQPRSRQEIDDAHALGGSSNASLDDVKVAAAAREHQGDVERNVGHGGGVLLLLENE